MYLEGKRLSAKACVSQIDRMLRPPHSFKVAVDLRRFLRRKVRLERRGFVGPVLASAEALIWRRPDVWRPRALRCP